MPNNESLNLDQVFKIYFYSDLLMEYIYFYTSSVIQWTSDFQNLKENAQLKSKFLNATSSKILISVISDFSKFILKPKA